MFQNYLNCIFSHLSIHLFQTTNSKNVLLQINNLELFSNVLNENYYNKILMNVIDISPEELNISSHNYINNGERYIKKKTPDYFSIILAFHSTYINEKLSLGYQYLSDIICFLKHNSKFILESNLQEFFVNLIKNKETIYKIKTENKILCAPTLFYSVGIIGISDDSLNTETVSTFKTIQ